MKNLSRRTLAVAGAAALLAGCNDMKTIRHLPYPEAERTDVKDVYFGTEVADPYRWLEDDNSQRTADWVAAENAVTQHYLEQIPFRGAIRERLTRLWNYAKPGIPEKHGDYWYYTYNDGLRNQAVIYRTSRPGEPGEVFLDPNALSDDGTVALVAVSFSRDGKYCAYAASASGSDWVEIRVKRTSDGTLADDRIEWVKFSGAEWAPDSDSITAPTTLPKRASTRRRTSSRRSITTSSAHRRRPTSWYTPTRNIRSAISTLRPRRTASGSSSPGRRAPRAARFSTSVSARGSSVRCCPASTPTITSWTARTIASII